MKAAISLIAAMATGRVIGGGNRLLWHLPEDFRHFKTMTVGKPVIMGRKTAESIGHALPKRMNVIITSTPGWTMAGASAVPTFEKALELAQTAGAEEIFVIGGAQVYAQALPFATTLYLTEIAGLYKGDAVFPEIDPSLWREVERIAGKECEKAGVSYDFVTYKRILGDEY